MDTENWAQSPDTALAFYLSLTFEQQCALAFVIDWHRNQVRKQGEQLIAQMRAEYERRIPVAS